MRSSLLCNRESINGVSPARMAWSGRSGRQSKHRLTSPDNAGRGHDKVPQGLCSNAPTGWCVSVTSYLLSQSHIVWKSDKGVILRAKQILDQHSYPETYSLKIDPNLIWNINAWTLICYSMLLMLQLSQNLVITLLILYCITVLDV